MAPKSSESVEKPRKRSTRDRPAKAPLSEEAIVEATLAIIREKGTQAVSMRSVAKALDTGPSSLYVYFDGRTALLNAVAGHLASSAAYEKPSAKTWRKQLHAFIDRIYARMIAYPGLPQVDFARTDTPDVFLRGTEHLLAVLIAGGIKPKDAVWASETLQSMTVGAATGSTERGDAAPEEQRDLVRRALGALPVEEFPLLTQYGPQIFDADDLERLHFAVDAFVDGLRARSA
jgi:AcrR family transcriptional regulator